MPFAMNSKGSMQAWLEGEIPDPDFNFTTIPELHQQTTLF
jgi:hypothetical protein